MDSYDRKIVEAIKRANSIKLVTDEGTDNEVIVHILSANAHIKRIAHDIALVIQDYFNRLNQNNQ